MMACVNLNIEQTAPAASARAAIRVHWLVPVLAAMALLWVPLLTASPANLTSDESLYLAEAQNIVDGEGFRYPSGEAITHRAPLYPLALAYAEALGGDDAAYVVPRLIVIVNALLVLVLATRIAGAAAGAVAGITASASAYLNGIGTMLYLDPMQCTGMLVALLAFFEAVREPRAGWFVVAGFWTGLAFLVKESTVQWLPLAAAAWLVLPTLRTLAGARGVLVFTLAFGAVVSPWWVWVYAHTSELYLIGHPSGAALGIMLLAAMAYTTFAVGVVAWPSLPERFRAQAASYAVPAACALITTWGVFLLYGLTRYSSWPYPNDYLSSVPDYLSSVAPQAQPYLLLALAWPVVAWRAQRGDEPSRTVVLAALLFAPFALFIANRGLQLRDALPIVYLSYVALGVAAATLLPRLRAVLDVPHANALLYAGVAFAGIAFAVHQAGVFRAENDEAASIGVRADNWDSSFVRDIAGWMSSNLPEGANVLSSRLYFSSIHTETEGRFHIRQMPTVRVDVTRSPNSETPLLVAKSNLFRWEDEAVRPTQPDDSWLYLRRFPGKGYWVGLRQEELLEYIVAHEIDFVVLTGEDVAFSTLQYADYFAAHPAFTLLYRMRASSSDQFFAYAVDRQMLFHNFHSTAISESDLAALEQQSGLSANEIEGALGTPLRVTDFERGLSTREEWGAISGIDFGLWRDR
jgi:4-amino-4-deoxy-L-arabinose transferase-like glycosyltransferase